MQTFKTIRAKFRVGVGAIALAFLFVAGFNGAVRADFQPGDVITYLQDDWGTPATTPGGILGAYYTSVYADPFGFLEVGPPLASGFSLLFTSANAVFAYLPSSGLPGQLNADLIDPTSSASGVFGGEVTGLKINVDFSDAGYTLGALGIPFGDLVLFDYTDLPQVNGLSVRQFLGEAEVLLGGGALAYDVNSAWTLTRQLNSAFYNGTQVAPFAQDHLRVVPQVVPNAVPEPSTAGMALCGALILIVAGYRRRSGNVAA